jgi:hypothetical protein
MAVTKNTGRLALAIALELLMALLFFGPGLSAAQQKSAPASPAQAAPKVDVSVYRNSPVPPNPANTPGPVQPIPYSHKLHLALGLQCTLCHQNPGDGALMTLPTAQTCMSCHKAIAADKPPIQKLTAYAKSGKPIPWVRVYVLLKGVNFSHKTHIAANVQCDTCHGPVQDFVVQHEATSITAMSVCLKCHTMNKAPTTCKTCHSWPNYKY